MSLELSPDQDIYNAVQAFGRNLLRNALPPPSYAGHNIDRDTEDAQFWAEEQITPNSNRVSIRHRQAQTETTEPIIPASRLEYFVR